jgi:hypothetical protein
MADVRRTRKRRGARAHAAKAAGGRPAPPGGHLVPLAITPDRMLERASRNFLADPSSACVKCGSTFVIREPAFVHCHYCGKMARIANASLGAQELFELRMGLRLAS